MEGGGVVSSEKQTTDPNTTTSSSSYTCWVREAKQDAAPLPVPRKLTAQDLSIGASSRNHLGSAWNKQNCPDYGYDVGQSFVQEDKPEEQLHEEEVSYPIIVSFETDQVFTSREELVDWVQRRGTDNGYVIVNRRSKKRGDHFVKIWLQCSLGGEYKSVATVRKTGSKKIGCPFQLVGVLDSKLGVWRLEVKNPNHNHIPIENSKPEPEVPASNMAQPGPLPDDPLAPPQPQVHHQDAPQIPHHVFDDLPPGAQLIARAFDRRLRRSERNQQWIIQCLQDIRALGGLPEYPLPPTPPTPPHQGEGEQ